MHSLSPLRITRRLPCSDFFAVFRFFRFSGGVTALPTASFCVAHYLSAPSPRKSRSATQVTATQSPGVPRGSRSSVGVLPLVLSAVLIATEQYHVCNDARSSLASSSQQPSSSFLEDRRKHRPCNLDYAAARKDGAPRHRQLARHRQGDRHQEPGECAMCATRVAPSATSFWSGVIYSCPVLLLLLTCGFHAFLFSCALHIARRKKEGR